MSKKNLLVVGAHSANFVWRAAGTIGDGATSKLRVTRGEESSQDNTRTHGDMMRPVCPGVPGERLRTPVRVL